MSLPATIAPAALDTVLENLALLFLTAGDPAAARHAASRMIAAYDVETEQELRLAAAIIRFGFEAMQALSQAAAPDLSLNQILRLRGGAVSLSRESHKFQRKFDQLQRARRAAKDQPPAETQPEAPAPQPETLAPQPEAPVPQPEAALPHPPIAEAAGPVEPVGKHNGMTWTQSYRQRQTAKRLAKRALEIQARLATPHAATPVAH